MRRAYNCERNRNVAAQHYQQLTTALVRIKVPIKNNTGTVFTTTELKIARMVAFSQRFFV